MKQVNCQIAEYSPVVAGLGELQRRMKDLVYDVTTTAGMGVAKADRRELVTLRTSLEAKRKEIKAPALERCKMIDTEAARIKGELLQLEIPIDEQIKAEEMRKEAIRQAKIDAEVKRVSDIMARIEAIKGIPANVMGKSSILINLQINSLDDMTIDKDEFQEFLSLVEESKKAAIIELLNMHDTKLSEEKEAARIKAEQEAKAAAEEAERQERDRLAKVESERLAAEAEALRIEKEAFAKQQAEAEAKRKAEDARLQAIRDEEERIKREARELEEAKAQAIRDAENKRIADEQAKAQAEIDRQQAEIAEATRRMNESEAARVAAELAESQRLAEVAAKKEMARIAALDEAKRNHARCSCPFCEGVQMMDAAA